MMGGDPKELFVTNLGPVPKGMSFLAAIKSVIGQRKYKINPELHSRRLTLCETLREIHRIALRVPETERRQIILLAGAAFDMAKRMDARIKELKEIIPDA